MVVHSFLIPEEEIHLLIIEIHPCSDASGAKFDRTSTGLFNETVKNGGQTEPFRQIGEIFYSDPEFNSIVRKKDNTQNLEAL